MKILLCAVNAKYIHSNPGIIDLKTYAQVQTRKADTEIETAAYTINQLRENILKDIYLRKPDVLIFSCYIWNISMIRMIASDFHNLLPSVPIWAGGPEVSYECEKTLEKNPWLFGIMAGEGEIIFHLLVSHYEGLQPIESIPQLIYRREGKIISQYGNPPAFSLSDLPSPASQIHPEDHKIYYYESSRGCPFSCSYCLSSVDKHLRFRDIELVKKDLDTFLSARIPQVKFIDRTFNCRREHALAIWHYIAKHDNGVTNFHFEIAADLLDDEMLDLFSQMRPGLIQLEIGVQTTNPQTMKAIHRHAEFTKIAKNVLCIHTFRNIHQHLDLIAGLPFEDYESFGHSFDDVFSLKPDQLQLGFLKVLKGSFMYDHKDEYDLVYSSEPPYEVLKTKWISYEDILKLKGIEDAVERYYNSLQFTASLPWIMKFFDRPFVFFEELASYLENLPEAGKNRQVLYERLLDFANKKRPEATHLLRQLLTFDIYLRESAKTRPVFAQDQTPYHEELSLAAHDLWEKSGTSISFKQFLHETHQEMFSFDPKALLEKGEVIEGHFICHFDYQNRDPLSRNAHIHILYGADSSVV